MIRRLESRAYNRVDTFDEAVAWRDKAIKQLKAGTFEFNNKTRRAYVTEWEKTRYEYIFSRETHGAGTVYRVRKRIDGIEKVRLFDNIREAIAYRDKASKFDRDITFGLIGRIFFEFRSGKRKIQMRYGDRSFDLKRKHVRALIKFLERFEKLID